MAYHCCALRRFVLIMLLFATCTVHVGCQSVKVTVNKREPWLNRRALENEGVVMLVVSDEKSKRKYPQLASSVAFL